MVPTYCSLSVTVTLLNSGISAGDMAPATVRRASVTTSSPRTPNSRPWMLLAPRIVIGPSAPRARNDSTTWRDSSGGGAPGDAAGDAAGRADGCECRVNGGGLVVSGGGELAGSGGLVRPAGGW